MAAANGHTEIIKLLLEAGAVSGRYECGLHVCGRCGCHRTHAPPIARELKYLPSIPTLYQNVSAANEEGNTPLHWACVNNQAQVADALLAAGASASALNKCAEL